MKKKIQFLVWKNTVKNRNKNVLNSLFERKGAGRQFQVEEVIN